jgi:hypothetical protein
MAHSVVLLDGEIGGFIVEGNVVKSIPKIGEDLRLHLAAVNALIKALEAGNELDPGRADLEALVVQAANLALRRLDRSVGIEAAPPIVAELEQLAEPLENAVETPEIAGISETAVVMIPAEVPAAMTDEIAAEMPEVAAEMTPDEPLLEASPVIPVEAEVAEAAPVETEAEAESIDPTEPEVEAANVVSMEPVMIEVAPSEPIEAVTEFEAVEETSMEAAVVEAAPIAAEPINADIEPVTPVEAANESAPETALEPQAIEVTSADQVDTEIAETAPTEVDEPIEAGSDTKEPVVAEATPAATLEPVNAEPVVAEPVVAESVSAELEVAVPVTNGASAAHVAEASEAEVQAEASTPLTLPESSETAMVTAEKEADENIDTNPQQLEPIHAQIIESVQASAEASS